MKYVARTRLHTLFPAEASHMEKQWDETLVQCYISFKNQGLPLSTFWTAFKDVCALVMPMGDAEALFQAQGKWTSVEAQLHKVRSTSQIGMR
eukprot:8805631-Alexandrium_andersonii.AAC.1